ncbi:hypothetical protein [Pseudomonas kurunegalensis]|uniref:hypothetical protein n=1 Tax=Pseudomonas kurunegalensis TaxID=485880 RepID=UPI004028FC85
MQKARLKTVLWWVVATLAAVPLTKLAESHLDVSFFSPAIVGLWNWIQSVWGWLGSDVSFPVWAVILTTLFMVSLLIPVGWMVYTGWFEDSESTRGILLTDDQQAVFVLIGRVIQQGTMPDFSTVLSYSGLTRIAAHNALDHLCHIGLVELESSPFGLQRFNLTARGRKHYLKLDERYGLDATP